MSLANHRQGCPGENQRTGTHPASCNGHSARPDLSQLHCQVSSGLDIAAYRGRFVHNPSRDIPYLTSPFPVLDKSLTNCPIVDLPQVYTTKQASTALRSPGPPAEGVGTRLEP